MGSWLATEKVQLDSMEQLNTNGNQHMHHKEQQILYGHTLSNMMVEKKQEIVIIGQYLMDMWNGSRINMMNLPVLQYPFF